jgi:hypothetical protein
LPLINEFFQNTNVGRESAARPAFGNWVSLDLWRDILGLVSCQRVSAFIDM